MISKKLQLNVRFVLIASLSLFFGSCNTNPPTSPDVIQTGNISLKIQIDTSMQYFSANKTVVLEYFTNVGCYPCPVVNKIVKNLSNETYGRTKLVPIKFPVNFPAPYDPFYQAAKEICDFRIEYYNVFSAPTIFIDGILRPIPSDSVSIIEAIDSRLSLTSRFYITVDSRLENEYEINVDVKFIDTSAISLSDVVIYTAITETDIEFQEPPGSNGETIFYDVIRLLLPTKRGVLLKELINQGQLLYEFEDAMLSDWNLDKMNVIVYIQDLSTKEVYQTGSNM